jgi:hypothetical protein
MSKFNVSCEAYTSLGEPKAYQAKEDKILAEAPSSIIQLQMFFELTSALI